ncbi:MAG: hypothetical protein OFPI_21700 [Osedax symbiont Rs2]|nr:MAG: hypothetical protein OFPI_21700 [Osedax symbiont Rs2]
MSKVKTESAKLLTEMVMAVFRLNGSILRAAEVICVDTALTPARWQVLGVVLEEPKTVSQIARNLGLTRQSVQRLADALVAENMASYIDNPAHARAKLCAVTDYGLEVIGQLADDQSIWANSITDSMNKKELQLCLNTMRELIARIEQKGC